MPATRFAALVSAKPGTLSMISARSAKSGVDLILVEMAASSLAISGQALQDAGMRFLSQSWRGMFALANQAHLGIYQIQARFHQALQLLTCPHRTSGSAHR